MKTVEFVWIWCENQPNMGLFIPSPLPKFTKLLRWHDLISFSLYSVIEAVSSKWRIVNQKFSRTAIRMLNGTRKAFNSACTVDKIFMARIALIMGLQNWRESWKCIQELRHVIYKFMSFIAFRVLTTTSTTKNNHKTISSALQTVAVQLTRTYGRQCIVYNCRNSLVIRTKYMISNISP